MKIAFPLLVRAKDSGDIAMFESIWDMQRELKAVDVENGAYEAWDRNGMSLNLGVQKPVWLRFEPSSSEAPGELRQTIVQLAKTKDVQLPDEEWAGLDCETLFRRVTEDQ